MSSKKEFHFFAAYDNPVDKVECYLQVSLYKESGMIYIQAEKKIFSMFESRIWIAYLKAYQKQAAVVHKKKKNENL